MKRFTIPIMIIIYLMIFTPVRAEITWKETEFDYSINNLSSFFYGQNQYYEDYNQYIKKDDASASYGSAAEIQVSEFADVPQPGSGVQIQAQARGPENGIDPPNGLMVQAYLSTVATGLNAQQGVDIDLEALSRVVRRFEVNQQENYSAKVELTGQTNFDGFYVDDQYRAFYSIRTEVKLEQIAGTGDQMVVQTMPGFPVVLDEANRTATVAVQLQSVDDQLRPITYRIKTELKLKSRIDNLTLQSWAVAGDVNGNYQVGFPSPQAPIILQATFNPGGTVDSDQDGVPDDLDNCPDDSNPDQLDGDGDGVGNACDDCPNDPLKSTPGICGCGIPDTDTDNDNTPDCNDGCPSDPLKTEPGICGCGTPDTDSDSDTVIDCQDGCPLDPQKIEPGICGCGVPESDADTDKDGVADCIDAFSDDPNEWEDTDRDGIGNNSDPDDDNDRMPDDWEDYYGLNPLIDDANEDPDKDGWSNLKEFKYGTDPTDPDSYPTVIMLPAIPLLLLFSDSDGEIDCSELMDNGCQLPPPSQLVASIETVTPEETYVNFGWSAHQCAQGYLFAAGTSIDLFNDPAAVVVSLALPSHRANFSSAPAANYYWAVTARCNPFTSEAGDWSDVKIFEFNP
jgi:hypothetical protein